VKEDTQMFPSAEFPFSVVLVQMTCHTVAAVCTRSQPEPSSQGEICITWLFLFYPTCVLLVPVRSG